MTVNFAFLGRLPIIGQKRMDGVRQKLHIHEERLIRKWFMEVNDIGEVALSLGVLRRPRLDA